MSGSSPFLPYLFFTLKTDELVPAILFQAKGLPEVSFACEK